MSAARYDITIEQGADWSLQMTWKDANSTAINLTSYTARLQARARASSSVKLIDLQNGSGITLGGVAGTITIVLNSAATAALTFSSAPYNLELISGSGLVTRVLTGYITVSTEIVR